MTRAHSDGNRRGLIHKVEQLVRLTASNRLGEARSAEDRAIALIDRYDVQPGELAPEILMTLRAIAAARYLTVQRSSWTRRMSEVDGSPDIWLTTGHGELPTEAMIRVAEKAGFSSGWAR